MKRIKSKLFTVLICAVLCCAMFATLSFTGAQKRTYADFEENENIQTLAEVTEQTGLGLGINVLTATKLNDFNTRYEILKDTNDFDVNRIELLENESFVYSTTDIKEFAMRYNFDLGIGAEVSTLIGAIKGNLSQGVSFNFANYKYKYYSTLEHYINRYRLYIKNYADSATYQNKLSDGFLSDVAALDAGETRADYFLEKYGTHLVGSAVYGGRLNAYNILVSNKLNLNAENKAKIDGAIDYNGLTSALKAKIFAALSIDEGLEYSNEDFETAFYVKARGGNSFASGNIDTFNQGYANWADSFNTYNNSVLVDYTKDGLVPIWDIIPGGYSNARTKLKNVFISMYNESASKFIEEYKTRIYIDEGDYIHFSGGTGTALDPYLITKPEQMLNIELDMNACYKLKNDISLSAYANWKPIGGYYKEMAFNGVFDGDGHTISGLTRTAEIEIKNNRIYFGLFGYVGASGVIKNLKLANVNISMNGPKSGGADLRIFIGVLVGSLYGKVTNVQTISGECYYSKCNKGYSFVGSVSGVANNATIENCTNNIPLTSGRYSAAVGGISGYISATNIKNCHNTAHLHTRVTGFWGWSLTGGIVGLKNSNTTSNIVNCSNSGDLTYETFGGGPKVYKYKDDIVAYSDGSVYN